MTVIVLAYNAREAMDAQNSQKKDALPFQPITLHNDAPVDRASEDVDFLNFTPLAKEVAAIAVGTDGPFTMAITAKWGYGKTSMLVVCPP